MRTLLSLAVVAVLLAATPVAADATPFNGAVLVSCNRVAPAAGFPDAVDPIVAFGMSPSAHDHAFFGSDQASANTTLPKMLTGGTSCDVKSDKSLYWHPTIVAADGSKVHPTRSSFYYRAVNRGVPIHPFPAGIRFVWGNPANTSSFSSVATWQCSGGSLTRSIPTSCPNGGGVQETVAVGPCWDGLDLGAGGGGHDTAAPSANLSAAPTGTDGKPHCPADHPVNVPALAYILNWPAAALGGRLSSDAAGAAPGASVHVDFFNAWTFNSQNNDAMAKLTDGCLNVDASPGTVSCQVISGQVVTNPGRVYVTD